MQAVQREGGRGDDQEVLCQYADEGVGTDDGTGAKEGFGLRPQEQLRGMLKKEQGGAEACGLRKRQERGTTAQKIVKIKS